MNSWLLLILLIIATGYLLHVTVALLNLKALSPELPGEFVGVYDDAQYAASQQYTRVRTRFSLASTTWSTVATLLFILLGGFPYIDQLVRALDLGEISSGLLFTATLLLLSLLLNLPFSIYSTFVIEERFGFNRTSPATFVLDIAKQVLLTGLIGGPLLALVLWFFSIAGNLAWLYCWLGISLFSLVMQFLAPVLIMPLFNKFTPLPAGALKDAVTSYTRREGFTIQGIYTMDGSRRSTKLNAFFTGFGRFRKIVFFDTLLEKLSTPEVVAVLAHEMGHFKLHHIFKMITFSLLQTGLMFYLLSLFMNNPAVFSAFQMENVSIYASLFFFGFLYAPLSTILGVAGNILSRHHEYQADSYAVRSTGTKNDMIEGLKKLSQANLSNLTPHPVAVFLTYSHPPVLQRLKAIRQLPEPSAPT